MRKLPVKRNGAFTPMDVTELVPGDVVFLRGGNVVPADSEIGRASCRERV